MKFADHFAGLLRQRGVHTEASENISIADDEKGSGNSGSDCRTSWQGVETDYSTDIVSGGVVIIGTTSALGEHGRQLMLIPVVLWESNKGMVECTTARKLADLETRVRLWYKARCAESRGHCCCAGMSL